MRILVRDSVLFIVFSIISAFLSLKLDDFFMNTIYTVAGIMFSIGLGLVAAFNLQGIKNKIFIKKIRTSLNTVRNSYIRYFIASTIVFVLDKYLREEKLNILSISMYDNFKIQLDLSVFFCLIILYSIFYYIINFVNIQSLNNDIFDVLNE